MTNRSNDWTGSALANDRYLITAKLGEGGMGTVYRARDRNIDADVVIKVPLRAMLEDPGFSRRFTDEIRSLVKLSHPHIVKVSDVGEWDGLPFAVMQYLPGGSLEDRRPAGRDGGPEASDPGEVPGWLVAIADALDYVHSQGYVHRDVKPGNLLFDGQGHAFLGDFGVVKVLASSADARGARTSLTGAGMVVGTPEYMAPELIMGEAFDGRVDQYALAVTVYEMLCGRRPFENEIKTRILVQHTTEPPPVPANLCPWISGRLSKAVLRGLAKAPDDRYPNCAALAAAVREAVESASVERVRIDCRSCGKALTVAPAELARLRAAGRRVICPACKAPVPLTGTVARPVDARTPGQGTARGGTLIQSATPGQGTARGGTLIQSAPGTPTPGESPRGDGRRATPPGGNTVALPAKGGSGAHPAAPRSDPRRTPSSSRRPSPTMVERHGQRDADASGLADQPGPPGEPIVTGNARGLWLSLGVAVGLTAAILGISFSMRPAAREAGSVAKPAEPRALPAPTVPAPPNVAARPAEPPTAVNPFTVKAGTAATEAAGSDRLTVAKGDERPAIPPHPGPGPDPAPVASPTKTGEDNVPLATGAELVRAEASRYEREPSPIADKGGSEDDPDSLGSKLASVKSNVPLEKVLDNPRLYARQLVELSRLYGIGNDTTPNADGSVSLPVIESDLSLQANGSVHVRRGKASVLDLDPKLVEPLVRLGRLHRWGGSPTEAQQWDNTLAILTVRVVERGTRGSSDWGCRIVKFEFLKNVGFSPVTIGYKKRLRFAYHAFTLTPDGEGPGETRPEDWASLSKLGHIVNQYKKWFETQTRQVSQAQWLRFNAQINAAISQGMRQAAGAQAADEAALRRMITPGR